MILPVLLCAHLLLHSNLIQIKSNSKLFQTRAWLFSHHRSRQQLTRGAYSLTQFARQILKMCFQGKQTSANFFFFLRARNSPQTNWKKKMKKRIFFKKRKKRKKEMTSKDGLAKLLSDTNVVKLIQLSQKIQFLPRWYSHQLVRMWARGNITIYLSIINISNTADFT